MALPVIIQIFLRGGQDGLSWCAPAADPLYQSTRGALAIPRNPSGNLGNYFTLPPAAYPLQPLYQTGKLAFVHGAGLLFQGPKIRSHFDTQRMHETAALTTPVTTGWLARGMDRFVPLSTSNLRGLGHSTFLPRVLNGASDTIATPDPINYDLPASLTLALEKTALAGMYAATAEPLSGAADSGLHAVDILNNVSWTPGTPPTDLGKALQNIADLILSDQSVVAFNVDLGGWDLHVNLGPLDGNMHGLMTALANELVTFQNRLSVPGAPEYILFCVTEFGRRFVPNNGAGLDHGWGSCITVMGNQGVNGGNVFIRGWGLPTSPPLPYPPPLPQLAPQIDADNDLIATIDYRQILAEALVKRMGVAPGDLGTIIFPGLTYDPLNVFV